MLNPKHDDEDDDKPVGMVKQNHVYIKRSVLYNLPFTQYLILADDDREWIHTDFAKGIQCGCCRRKGTATSIAKVWRGIYIAWSVFFFAFMTGSQSYRLYLCSHPLILIYLTTWQVIAVWSYSFVKMTTVLLLNFAWFRSDEDIAKPLTDDYKRNNPWKLRWMRFTWALFIIEFTLTAFVGLTYYALGGSMRKFTASSILAHMTPPLLSIIDFSVSGTSWPLSAVIWSAAIMLPYLLLNVVQWRAKWPRLADAGCTPDYSPPAYVYSAVDWNDADTALAAALGIAFFMPFMSFIIFFVSKACAYWEGTSAHKVKHNLLKHNSKR